MVIAHSFSGFDLFEVCPKRFYHLKVAKDVKEEDGESSLEGKRVHKALEDRLREGAPLPPYLFKHEDKCVAILNSGMDVIPEQELAINKELEPCDWWDKDVFLRVKADVALYKGQKAALLDWKTGKRKLKPFQLELGALSQFLHYPNIKLTKGAFLWLKEDKTDPVVYTREDDYERILSKLQAKADKIDEAAQDGVWEAKPGYHCNWCGLKDTCSYSQAKR